MRFDHSVVSLSLLIPSNTFTTTQSALSWSFFGLFLDWLDIGVGDTDVMWARSAARSLRLTEELTPRGAVRR